MTWPSQPLYRKVRRSGDLPSLNHDQGEAGEGGQRSKAGEKEGKAGKVEVSGRDQVLGGWGRGGRIENREGGGEGLRTGRVEARGRDRRQGGWRRGAGTEDREGGCRTRGRDQGPCSTP